MTRTELPWAKKVGICGLVALALGGAVVCSGSPGERRDGAEMHFASTSRIVQVTNIVRAPSAAQQIRVTVQSTVTPGPRAGYYTYTYVVTNEHNSTGPVSVFGIAPVPHADSVFAPPQWMAGYGWQEVDSAIVWSVADTLTPPPADWDSTNVYPSPYAIQINNSLTFRVVDHAVPSPTPSIAFYAQGFDTLAEAGGFSTGLMGGFDYPSLFQGGVTGFVYGPYSYIIVGANDGSSQPTQAPKMARPAPNPTSRLCSIAFSLGAPARARVTVYDIQGRLVRQLLDADKPRGYHTVTWNAVDSGGHTVAAGTYLVRFEVNGRSVETRKVTVLK